MKRTLLFVLAIFLVLLVASPIFASGSGEKGKGKTVTVAFMPGVADPFYFTMERGIRAKAKELGVNVIVGDYPTSWGPEVQVPILQAMMAKGGIDVLLIAPTSVDSLVAPLKKIYDSGVQIITVDTFLGDGDYTKTSNYSFPLAFIGTDNVLGGKQVAEHLAKLVGEKGKVFLENTNPGVSSVQGRLDRLQGWNRRVPQHDIRRAGLLQRRAAEGNGPGVRPPSRRTPTSSAFSASTCSPPRAVTRPW